MSYQGQLAAKVKKDAAERLSKHQIITKKIDGLYRQWWCGCPDSGCDWFYIVTWPGYMCYCGDMGDYVFQRVDDMVLFMRRSAMSFDYAAEKCIAHGSPIRKYCYEVFEDLLNDEEKLLEEEYEPEDQQGRRDKIADLRAQINEESHEHEAYMAISDSGLWDGCDFPSCEAFDFHFLWCLHAIDWFTKNVKDA